MNDRDYFIVLLNKLLEKTPKEIGIIYDLSERSIQRIIKENRADAFQTFGMDITNSLFLPVVLKENHEDFKEMVKKTTPRYMAQLLVMNACMNTDKQTLWDLANLVSPK